VKKLILHTFACTFCCLFLSNLRFNNAIVAKTQPSLEQKSDRFSFVRERKIMSLVLILSVLGGVSTIGAIDVLGQFIQTESNKNKDPKDNNPNPTSVENAEMIVNDSHNSKKKF